MKRMMEAKLDGLYPAKFPARLHLRSDLHIVRKSWHMVMGLLIAFIYLSGLSQGISLLILTAFLFLALAIEFARLRSPSFNEKIIHYWRPVMRNSEVGRVSGTPYYLMAAVLAVGIFPKPVAVLCLFYLACGDPMASLFGVLFGCNSIKLAENKSLVGTLAGVFTCIFLSFFYLKTLPISDANLVALTLIGGLVGGTAELLPLDIDDNFTIPMVSGFVLWFAFIFLGAA